MLGGICGDDIFCLDIFNLVGDELMFGSEEGVVIVFQVVKNQGNVYVGVWYLLEDVGFNVLMILDGGYYVVVYFDNQEVYIGDDLIVMLFEWGMYFIINDQFQVIGVEIEIDGSGGLYDVSNFGGVGVSVMVEVIVYGDLVMVFDVEDIIIFGCIGCFSVVLWDFVGNCSVVLVECFEQVFEEGISVDFIIELVGEEDSVDVFLNGDGSGMMMFFFGIQD